MSRMIFVNLPTNDLSAADRFYAALGFTKNDVFSDENASSWVISDAITIMVLRSEFFATFLVDGDEPVVGGTSREALNALSSDTREGVDEFLANAEKGGGTIYRAAAEPFPGMYQGAVKDPDGHVWEIAWMSPEAIEAGGQ